MMVPVAIYTVSVYLIDVVARPRLVAQQARAAADARGKPMLNIGAGTPNSSLSSMLFGPMLVGDVNMDVASNEAVCTIENVCYGDIETIPFDDKQFGSCFASHVLEHTDNPDLALQEMNRVADEVFVVVPPWYCPHTWLHPGHKWFISQDLTRKRKLWNVKNA
jgi:ubiquinone/menaquinone biosynthesis C-methylase UbiE